ncbi:adenine phosphoribosyltransferase [Mycobacterium rhizamassiliense]|jgi:adenine phosphoribosyltransferase
MGFGAVTTIKDAPDLGDIIEPLTRKVADFPEPGVQFKDLTPLFADRDAMCAITDALAGVAAGVDLVAGVDSRGFLVAAAVAARLGVGVLAIRKGGKLPPPVLSESYDLEYGSATLEIPADGIELRRRNVMVIDDVLATGGTLGASARLLQRAEANVVGVAVVMELVELGGRAALAPLPVHTLSRV